MALFTPASCATGLLVAVSGGPDSMALLDLAARWRDETTGGQRRPPVFAATVHHGLREGSRNEAEMVAGYAKARGVPHSILEWTGEKPRSRLQERARDARYALLADEARRLGADHILTAHHADDQSETILMRLLRGSAVAGLAGMAALSRREGLTLFRPLLGVRKADLVAYCDHARFPFVRDPSNDNPRFGRTGARRLAALLEAEGLGPGEWARLARRAARAEAALTAAAGDALTRLPQGAVPMEALVGMPEEIAMRCLAARARASGGAETVRLERLEAAWARIVDAHAGGRELTLTLAGARIRLDRRGLLAMEPEPRRRRGLSGAKAPHLVHPNGQNKEFPEDRREPSRGASLGNEVSRA